MNIDLAKNCSKNEKAFELSTKGKVLGIFFDSSDMTWSFTCEKRDKILRTIFDSTQSDLITVNQMQILMGHLNDCSLMSPFLSGFKRNLNEDLGFSSKQKKK